MLWPILSRAVKSAGRVAVVDDQRQYTYSQILGGAMFLAEQLDQETAAPRVGIMLPTGGAFPIALLGTWLSGRVSVPLNYLLSAKELAYVAHDSGLDTVITATPMIDYLSGGGGDEARPSPFHEGVKLLKLDQADFSEWPPLRWPPVCRSGDLAVILYTSGTSGQPKGVMLTHANLFSNVTGGIEHAKITHADTFLGVLPQFHSFGFTGLTLIPLYVGAKVVYTARFVPKKIVSLIHRHRPDVIMAVPSMYGAFLSVKEAGPEDFGSVRLAVSGGEPLPSATYDQCLDRLGLRLLEGYGLTETAPITNWSTPERFKRHSVGTALPGVTVITVDEHDQPLPPDREGEVLVAGPNIMSGYYNLPQQTAEAFVDIPPPPQTPPLPEVPPDSPPPPTVSLESMPDGWPRVGRDGARHWPSRFFRTGDIGRIDPDGYLFITGRKKEMLVIGGENVFPRQIEEVLNQHPSVRDSAVIGKHDPVRGEVPVAFVEVEEDQTFDEPALRSWCRSHLAGFKVPREVYRIDALPRNPTGKVLRKRLTVPKVAPETAKV